MKNKLFEEKGPYQYEPWCDEAADSIENGNVQGDLNYGYSYGPILINGEDASTFFKSNEVKELILRDISYPVKDGHASYSGLDEVVGTYSSLNFSDPDVQADLIKLGFDEDDIKALANHQGDEVEEIETWIDYDIQIDDSEVDYDDEDEDELNESVNITEAFSGEKGIETIVPFFSGFYNTMFEEYWNSKEEVGKIFTNVINKKIAEILPSFKYEFQHIQSPKYYNYGTDEIYAKAIFNTTELFEFLNQNLDEFEKYCKANFSSYDGFISFLPDNAKEFMEKIKTVSGRYESSFVFGAIEFALEKSFGENIRYDLNEEAYYDCSDQLEPDEYEYEDDEVEESYPFKKNPVCKDKRIGADDPTDDGTEGEGVSESLGKVLVNVFSPKVGGWHSMLFNSVEEAKRWIKDFELDLSEDYFEIHTGDNTTDVNGLVAWGGKGGFWANVVSGQFDDFAFNKNKSEGEKVRDKKIRQAALKKEVKNGTLDEGFKDYLPRGGFIRDDDDDKFSTKMGAFFGQGTDEQLRKAKIIARVKFSQGDRFGRVTKEDLDNFEDYKEAYNEMFGSDEIDEGWKDNLKKVAGVAAVAGGLMAGNAHASDKPMDFNDGAQEDGQFTAYYQDDESPITDLYKQHNIEFDDEMYDGGFNQTSSIDDLNDFAKSEGYKFLGNHKYKGKDGKIYDESELRQIMLYGEIIEESLYESQDPTENTEEPAKKSDGDSKGQDISKCPINDTEVKIDDIEVRDNAWEELDLTGIMSKIEKADNEAMLSGNTAENTNVSLRTSTAKSTTAEMKPSENKKQEKSKEPEIDKTDQKDRILNAEKTKAEIHESFEFKFIKEAEGDDVISFEITNGDGFPCKVEVSNKSSGQFTADELKKVIERENPSIWFNDAEAKYWFMDFSFEKGGKTYWISSDYIAGDMSKYELSIYDGNDYGNDDDDKKLNEAKKDSAYKLVKKTPDFDIYQDFEGYFMKVGKDGKVIDQGFLSVEDAMNDGRKATQIGDKLDEEQMLDEGKARLDTLHKLMDKCWYNSKDGRGARLGNWEMALGGYDKGYEFYYNNMPLFAINRWNEIDFYQDSENTKKYCGYTNKEIFDSLKTYRDLNDLKTSEELTEAKKSKKDVRYILEIDLTNTGCNTYADAKMYIVEPDPYGPNGMNVVPQSDYSMTYMDYDWDDIVYMIKQKAEEIFGREDFETFINGVKEEDFEYPEYDDYDEDLDESSRLSELASKMVLREADESSVAKVKINSIEFKYKEGAQDDKNWVDGKTYSFEEFQKLVYEYDYAFQAQADNGGYDKLWYTADITVDYNGKQEHIGYDGRLDLGDGKYGLDSVSVAFMVKQGVAHDLGIDPNQVEILNQEVPYDSKAFAAKYGTHEENLDKFLADKASEIKTPKYSKDSDNITPEEIEVGDYFADNDSNGFYRVVRRSKASVWLEKVKSKVIRVPYKNNRGELEYNNDAYPTTEPDNEDRWSWFDTSKPFRLGGYGHYVSASQGRHSLWFWGGKEIAESFAKKGKALMEDEEVLPETDQPFENPFKEGDILFSSWGYSMRLVDFYKVISSSKSFVKLAHLQDYNSKQDEWGQAGYKMPKLDQVEPDSNVDGRRFKVHIRDDGKPFVKINNYEWAEMWDGKPKAFDTYD